MSRDLLLSNSECELGILIDEFLFLLIDVLGEVFTAFAIIEILDSSCKFIFFTDTLLLDSLLLDNIFPLKLY